MNKLLAFFVVLAVALPLRAQSAAEARPVFLVTDVVVADDVPIEKDTARDVLATRFGRLKDKLEVRSMAEVRASVDNAAFQQLLGSEDEADLSKIENYVKVDRLVLGRIAMVAGVVDVQVKVFNVREGVVEVGFARRLGKGADRTLILTLLDGLADSLLAWTINTYTDGSMSAEATKLASKKLTKKADPAAASSSSSPWSALGAVGGGVLGAGLVATGLGAYNTFSTTDGASTTNIATFAGGAAAVVVGGVLVGVDLATE
jgi:hypothetical protein